MKYKDLEERINKGTVVDGTHFWVVDFRHENVLEKPIRNVKPTEVVLMGNASLPKGKRVYYAEHHFRPIGKNGNPMAKVIAPYDNTGFRGYTGESLNIFHTKQEAVDFYKKQCEKVQEQLEEADKAWKIRHETILDDLNMRVADFA